jgi:predicted lipoprotein with Yx(FWY)xxD motif
MEVSVSPFHAKRWSLRIAAALAIAAISASVLPHSSSAASLQLVRVVKQAQFGTILATPHNMALYYYTPEKDGKIHCTGSCAKVWPPLLVPAGASVAAHISGAMGMFGTIVRPDHTRQVTYQGKPLYAFVSDKKPLQVLCNGVGGWYVLRLTH